MVRRPELDLGVNDARRTDDLLRHPRRMTKLVRPRRRGDEDHLARLVQELVEAQRPVVESRRKAKAVLDERFLPRPVALVHPAELRHRLVRMRGASTCWAQPCSSATRPRRGPIAGKTEPPAGPDGGRLRGASASIALMRRNKPGDAAAVLGVGNNAPSGRPSRARIMLQRNRCGRGSTKARTARSARSVSGRV